MQIADDKSKIWLILTLRRERRNLSSAYDESTHWKLLRYLYDQVCSLTEKLAVGRKQTRVDLADLAPLWSAIGHFSRHLYKAEVSFLR